MAYRLSEESLLSELESAVGAQRIPVLAELVRKHSTRVTDQGRTTSSATIRAEEALALCSETQDPRLHAAAHSAMTYARFLTDDMAGVDQFGSRALELYGESSASYGYLDALLLVGIERRRRGELTEAIALTTRALGVCQELGDHIQEATSNSNLGLMYVDLSDYDDALVHFTAAVKVLGEGKDPATVSLRAGIYNNIGLAHRSCERKEEAVKCFERGVQCMEGSGTEVEAHLLSNYAGSLRNFDKLEQCREVSLQAVEIYRRIGGATNLGLAERIQGMLANDLDDSVEACGHFERGLELFIEGGHGRMATVCRIAAAACHDEAGNSPRAEKLLADAESWATEAGNELLQLQVMDAWATQAQHSGDLERALMEAQRARELAVHLAESGANRQTDALRARLEQQQHEHETELLKRRTDELEALVTERTTEIQAANRQLQLEIEEHRRTEASLRVARDKAQVADRAKTTFLAVASHELRTPLNAIKGYTEMIVDDLGAAIEVDEIRGDLDRILGSTDRLMATVQRILSMADLEAGNSAITRVAFHPAGLAEKVVTDCTTRAGLSNNELLLDCGSAGEEVWGDPEKTEQILHNLLDNATKFTRDGRIHVVVSTPELDGRRVLQLEVRDTGVGFDPTSIDRLTASFTQHDGSYKRQFEGLGLGLAIVSRFVEILDGNLDVRSAPGEGSSFVVTLPAEPAQA